MLLSMLALYPPEEAAEVYPHTVVSVLALSIAFTHRPTSPTYATPRGPVAASVHPLPASPPEESCLRAYLEAYLATLQVGDFATFPDEFTPPTPGATGEASSVVAAHGELRPSHGGVVLDGFPATAAQASLLEKELTGSVS